MATLSTANPTRIGLESDLFQRVDRSATNRLSHGTVHLGPIFTSEYRTFPVKSRAHVRNLLNSGVMP
jgi:hypothetical protein